MFVKCDDCGKVYDDAVRWKICPHKVFEATANVLRYCPKHDLFNCFICALDRAPESM